MCPLSYQSLELNSSNCRPSTVEYYNPVIQSQFEDLARRGKRLSPSPAHHRVGSHRNSRLINQYNLRSHDASPKCSNIVSTWPVFPSSVTPPYSPPGAQRRSHSLRGRAIGPDSAGVGSGTQVESVTACPPATKPHRLGAGGHGRPNVTASECRERAGSTQVRGWTVTTAINGRREPT